MTTAQRPGSVDQELVLDLGCLGAQLLPAVAPARSVISLYGGSPHNNNRFGSEFPVACDMSIDLSWDTDRAPPFLGNSMIPLAPRSALSLSMSLSPPRIASPDGCGFLAFRQPV
jgi:hypothetical protein